MLLDGRIDATSIDSTVLDLEDVDGIRILETWGPSPIPPFLASTTVPKPEREHLRQLLLQLHTHDAGRAALALGGVARFQAVAAADYQPITAMWDAGAPARLNA